MASLTKRKIRSIIKRIERGQTQAAVLKEEGISYTVWRSALDSAGIDWRPTPIYNLDTLYLVQRRARSGEFICDICDELGLDYQNLCRACRRAGIRILDKRSLQANIKRRNHRVPRRKPGEPPKAPAIYAALDAGATAADLQREFDITGSYARVCCKKHREGRHLAIQSRRK